MRCFLLSLVFVAVCGLAACDTSSIKSTTASGALSALSLPHGCQLVDPDTVETAWTWVTVPGMKCRDDSDTGFAYRPGNAGNDSLVIYVKGGGACFNQETCDHRPGNRYYTCDKFYLGSTHQDDFDDRVGYEKAEEELRIRNDAFRNWTAIYLPYCSGDLFTGGGVVRHINGVSYGSRHYFGGYDNMGYLLETIDDLVAQGEFVAPNYSVLIGRSAGGFGVMFNYDRIADHFSTIPVHAFSDTGLLPRTDSVLTFALENTLDSLWQMDDLLNDMGYPYPSLRYVVNYAAQQHPTNRLALLASTRDCTVRGLFAFENSPDNLGMCSGQDAVKAGIFERSVVDTVYPRDSAGVYPGYADLGNVYTFFRRSGGHTFLGTNSGALASCLDIWFPTIAFNQGVDPVDHVLFSNDTCEALLNPW